VADTYDFSGVWHSTYYFTNKLEGKGKSEHDVKIYKTGNQVVMQSLPNKEESYIILRLTLDDNLLTGTWNEQTSPTGKYEGQTYYGAVQLMIDKDGNKIHGKTVSYNHEMEIISDNWEIVRTDKKEK
jgi:hypothetical protein